MSEHQPQDRLVVVGASEHNLKNVDLTLPRNALIGPIEFPISYRRLLENRLNRIQTGPLPKESALPHLPDLLRLSSS